MRTTQVITPIVTRLDNSFRGDAGIMLVIDGAHRLPALLGVHIGSSGPQTKDCGSAMIYYQMLGFNVCMKLADSRGIIPVR
jgi:hypothetical protein